VESGHWLIAANDPRRALFDALGFEAQSESGEISYERADLFDRDVLFVIGAAEEELMVSPIFAQLNVVKSGGVIYTTFDTPLAGALSYGGPNALLYALELLIPQLTAALDGDLATTP
jgi:iron complex transport system substrate-binding protein